MKIPPSTEVITAVGKMQTRGRKHNWKQVRENVFSISLFCIYFSSWERTLSAVSMETSWLLLCITCIINCDANRSRRSFFFNFCIGWLRQTCCDKDRMNCKPWGVQVISIQSTAEVKMLALFKLQWITMSRSLPFTHSSCVYSKLTVEWFHWTHASKIFFFSPHQPRQKSIITQCERPVICPLNQHEAVVDVKTFWSKCWK